jgi:hypothetical protein
LVDADFEFDSIVTTPRRRWFEFSLAMPKPLSPRRLSYRLKTLFLAQLEDRGFDAAVFDGPWSSWELRTSQMPQGWWRDLATRVLGARVVYLTRGAAEVNDARPLAAFPNLQMLRINGAKVRDVTPLARLTDLRNLDLSHTRVRDLKPLAGLTRLKYLGVRGTDVSDLTPLHALTNLRQIDVTDTQVSDEQIVALEKALPNCDVIWDNRTSP